MGRRRWRDKAADGQRPRTPAQCRVCKLAVSRVLDPFLRCCGHYRRTMGDVPLTGERVRATYARTGTAVDLFISELL
jgi:hypothetical protein